MTFSMPGRTNEIRRRGQADPDGSLGDGRSEADFERAADPVHDGFRRMPPVILRAALGRTADERRLLETIPQIATLCRVRRG